MPIPEIHTPYKPLNWLKLLLYTVLVSFILYQARDLLIPLSYALLIAFILYPLCKWLEGKGMSKVGAISIGIGLLMLLMVVMIGLLVIQFQSFLKEWPILQTKLLGLLNELKIYLIQNWGIKEAQVDKWFDDALNNSGSASISKVGTSLVSLAVSMVVVFIIPIFSFLMLLSRKQLMKALFLLFPEEKRAGIYEVVRLSIHTYFNFIKGMLRVYFIVGVLNSVGLLLLGIPYAFVFGFLTAIMTFIPYVGILVASLLPITFAWLTYNSVWYPVGVIAIFSFVQYLEANIIFPWAVSHKLKLNTLMTLVMILTGGIIWGGSGMILFVPFAGILKLIADRIPGWEALAVLLGEENEKR